MNTAIESYRAFRASTLRSIDKRQYHTSTEYPSASEHNNIFAKKRGAVTEFRSQVAYSVASLVFEKPDGEFLVRRTLGISLTVKLSESKWQWIAQIGLAFLPEAYLLRRARKILSQSSSLEGRSYLFKKYVRLALYGRLYYDDSLDFALRHFPQIHSVKELENMQRIGVDALKVAHLWNMTSPSLVCETFKKRPERVHPRLLHVLARERILQKADELTWADLPKTETHWHAYDSVKPGAVDLGHVYAMVKCLKKQGVHRKHIAGIFRYYIHSFDPERLSDNFALLNNAGIGDLSRVFELTGDRLWRGTKENWQFILHNIGVRDADGIGGFVRLLDTQQDLSVDFLNALVALGATHADVSLFQELLVNLSRDSVDVQEAINGLNLLASPPTGFTFDTLAQCNGYLTRSGDLTAFVQVLTAQGYGTAQEILAFQCCYPSVGAHGLDQLLKVVASRRGTRTVDEVAKWAERAGRGGHYDSLEFLASAVHLADLVSLEQALQLLPLGKAILRYVIEEKGLRSLKDIKHWYNNKANGIDACKIWHPFDGIDKALFDDAWDRLQFSQVVSNYGCIADVVHEHAFQILGQFPFNGSEDERAAYREQRDHLEAKDRALLMSVLPSVLKRAGGVIIPSFFEGVWTDQYDLEKQIAQVMPLLDGLLEGQGPHADELTKGEVEAIALIYRTSSEYIKGLWPYIKGHEQDIGNLQLQKSYPMCWLPSHRHIPEHLALDAEGMVTLTRASDYAKQFLAHFSTDHKVACKGLSPKRVLEPSKDIGTLAKHLGILLAVASTDTVVRSWLDEGFATLREMDQDSAMAFQRVSELVDLFEVSLPDALTATTSSFVNGLNAQAASHLAARLVALETTDTLLTNADKLLTTLSRVSSEILPIYHRWANLQLAKFKKTGDAIEAGRVLRAVVSKHPASFFAKKAVNLCTAGNYAMWQEKRQVHLLVFDTNVRILVGMAMLYFETITALDPIRPSLVIRAINPTDEMLASHTEESIVQSFFDVAIAIAKDNNIQCVAIPSPSGMHLMSNRGVIENRIKDMCQPNQRNGMKQARFQPVSARFYAFEQGRELVDTLYVVWRATDQEAENVPHVHSKTSVEVA